MRNIVIITFISLLFFSCTKKENTFDSFDYSYDDTFSESYSIKFTQSDTIYVFIHWSAKNSFDSISIPKIKTTYYGILDHSEKLKLSSYVEEINLYKFKSEYFEDYSDGRSYGINIKKNGKNKTILVHSHNAPKELDSLAKWISSLKPKLQLKETKKSFHFESAKFVLPPPPPPLKNINN